MPSGIYKRSREVIEKIANSNRGKKRSVETKLKMSKASLGKQKSKTHKINISKSHIGINSGDKHPNWQGGKSFEDYTTDWNFTFKESIRQRDNFICYECGIHQDELDIGQVEKLDVHHIDYNKKNCNPNNLISLCRSCHAKTNYNRDYWFNKYKNIWEL